jgi:hypothetical protein
LIFKLPRVAVIVAVNSELRYILFYINKCSLAMTHDPPHSLFHSSPSNRQTLTFNLTLGLSCAQKAIKSIAVTNLPSLMCLCTASEQALITGAHYAVADEDLEFIGWGVGVEGGALALQDVGGVHPTGKSSLKISSIQRYLLGYM